ncbi:MULTISPECIES: LysR family transcriptional regulator [unclassified Crossiella]|uniref:LysR family transcriptional regulator n=1 Tax=unclassified Crossiella TaxID=2620835 RepID=UPI001FFFCCA1|nr:MULTISPECIES: LysR family transcriptional regulator [unclassified Crossiella]MCK2243464.1 LysR family transcriptional regulator [Crossiella sp. S99.2]MCK2257322.1 LysR family transcriptional regulator [Crossiella sp. S99.1]
MRLRQLEYFLAVVAEGSITAAAASLLVAQPSLSSQITALEQEVGAPLLERLPRGVRLTPAGRAFLAEASTAVLAAGRAGKAARNVRDGLAGELEVATVGSMAVGVLPPSIEAWHRRRPAASLRLIEYRHAELLEQDVAGGVGDLAFGPRPRREFPIMVDISVEEFVIVLPPHDPLAAETRIDVSWLAERRWVLFAADHGLSEVVTAVCARAGFCPAAAVHTAQVEAAARLAAAGLGPALVPDNVVPPGLRATVRPLAEPELRELVAYARAPLGPLAESYVDALTRTANRPRRR